MSKVWIVRVTVELDMPVYAADMEQAERIAERDWNEEFDNGVAITICAAASQIVSSNLVPKNMRGCIPWGEENDRTIDDILLGVKP